MATDATPGTSGSNLEERLAQLEAGLAQKDAEITAFRARTAQNPPPTVEVPPVVHTTAPATQPTTLIPEAVQQMITETFKALQLGATANSSTGYQKAYPVYIDLVPFPPNYQQPQFSHFDGTGSPTEHIAHFLSQCGDTAQSGPFLMRQFVQTLRKAAFTWYSKLPPRKIENWDQMERAFLQRFYSTQKSVGITKLTQTTQRNSEEAADFITRWRNLSLHCPQSISEREAIRMCMNNLKRDSPSTGCQTRNLQGLILPGDRYIEFSRS
ncbi:hypothetical protein VitviT2T_015785 [Vitis vinifera]|uniref:Retrotransposon gag domain-containing protein n=1 Tax=Vitis vinifera TaxID=29760 RepID=A0ABY9CPQ6_VITVI|nr:hypothetical protein VitviT2T_015785 [Vitis vinifera]